MQFRIETLPAKKLVGQRMTFSFSQNRTGELWKNFMQRRKEIRNNLNDRLYSMQIYAPSYFNPFNPNAEFEKWASAEVEDFIAIPEGMETFLLQGGLYAVFLHKGSHTDNTTFRYIFTEWLPNADYVLDDRPHFEILGKKYKNGDPDSEEEIWIPIRPK